MIDLQQLIRFYKNEVKQNPDCLASVALLARSRAKLLKMKELI